MRDMAETPALSELPANPRELSAAEQVLLGATRLWVSKAKSAAAAYEATSYYFSLFGIEQAARSHATVLEHSAVAARRKIRIDCLCSPCLTRDEARIVHAVGHAQADRMRAARRELESWLRDAAVRLTLPALAALAATLTGRGLVVEVRPWRTEAPTPLQPTPDDASWPPASRLVH